MLTLRFLLIAALVVAVSASTPSTLTHIPFLGTLFELFRRWSLPGTASSPTFTHRAQRILLEQSATQIPILHSQPCTNPVIREEWRTLTDAQKAAWTRAVKCLAMHPRSGRLKPTGFRSPSHLVQFPPVNESSSWYDDFAYAHLDLNTQVHQTGLFFPWHRYFLWSFEHALRTQCGYTGTLPYWDWSQDAHSFRNASIFSPDPLTGLGSFPDSTVDRPLTTGAFSTLHLAYPQPHILHRSYSPYPYVNMSPPMYTGDLRIHAQDTFGPVEVRNLVHGWKGDFNGFQTYLEDAKGMHMSIHFIVGGDLGGHCPDRDFSACVHDATPNDPIFWLHHGMIDKIWNDWQHADPSNYRALSGVGTVRDLLTWPKYPTGRPPFMTPQTSLPSDGLLLGNYTVEDMFNISSGAPLCYKYGGSRI